MKTCETCERFNQNKIAYMACIVCKFDGELTKWKPNKFIQSLIDEAELRGFESAVKVYGDIHAEIKERFSKRKQAYHETL